MITSDFFDHAMSTDKLEESLIQLNYNILYYSAFQSRKSLIKEKKIRFILVSLHKWLKDNGIDIANIEYVGNIHFMLHAKDFEFHIKSINTDTIHTVNFKMQNHHFN